MTESPAFRVGRDQHGLTAMERETYALVVLGTTPVGMRGPLGHVTKQRVLQLLQSLESKGYIARRPDGGWAAVTVTPPEENP